VVPVRTVVRPTLVWIFEMYDAAIQLVPDVATCILSEHVRVAVETGQTFSKAMT
jgi:hypothetical protein